MLLLDERILADGSHVRTFASLDGERVRIHDDEHAAERADGALSILAIDRVMARYGRELDAELLVDASPRRVLDPARVVDSLALGDYRLVRFRYHAAVDATGRDYLVWEAPGADPVAVVATMATAALRYLVLRLATDEKPGSQIPET